MCTVQSCLCALSYECSPCDIFTIFILADIFFLSQWASVCCASVSGTLIKAQFLVRWSSREINLPRFLRGLPLYASLPPSAITQCIWSRCLHSSSTTQAHTHTHTHTYCVCVCWIEWKGDKNREVSTGN